jgi:hypothetical protein
VLLAGFCNPALHVFDDALAERGELVVRHTLPYSDLASLTDQERRRYTERASRWYFRCTAAPGAGDLRPSPDAQSLPQKA